MQQEAKSGSNHNFTQFWHAGNSIFGDQMEGPEKEHHSVPDSPDRKTQHAESATNFYTFFLMTNVGQYSFLPFLKVLDCWTLTAQSPAPPFPQLLPLVSRQSTPGLAKIL